MFSQFDIGSHQIRLKATGFLHSASSHLDNVNDELFAKPKRSSLPKPDLEELPCCGFLYFWVSVCKRQQKWVSFGCYPAILLLATTIQIRTILLTDITKMTPDQPDRVWSIQLKIRWTDQIFGGIEISLKKKNRRNILIEKSLTGSWVCQRGPVWSGRNFWGKKSLSTFKTKSRHPVTLKCACIDVHLCLC